MNVNSIGKRKIALFTNNVHSLPQSHSKIFHSYGDLTINVEGLQFFIYTFEQRGFFSVPHLYECHIREPVTLTPVSENFAVELSLPVFTT